MTTAIGLDFHVSGRNPVIIDRHLLRELVVSLSTLMATASAALGDVNYFLTHNFGKDSMGQLGLLRLFGDIMKHDLKLNLLLTAILSSLAGLLKVIGKFGNTLFFVVCFSIGTFVVAAPLGTITRVAGDPAGNPGSSGDGGPALSAMLNFPVAVTVNNASGDLYLSDFYNYRVRKVSASTKIITTVAGSYGGYGGDGGPATSAGLWNVTGMAFDRYGNMYLADQNNQRVRKVDAVTGIITTVAGIGTAGFSGDGGPATQAEFNNPTGVAADIYGNLYIADQTNHRVRRVDAGTGIIQTVAGNGVYNSSGDGGLATSASMYNPYSVVIDTYGNLYVADPTDHAIRKVAAATGIITTYAGINGIGGYTGDGGPATSARLRWPYRMTLDGNNNLYIADSNNHVIRKITYSTGIISTIAGLGWSALSGDGGPAIQAGLAYPQGVALDRSGNLYIADTNNYEIRMVNLGSAAASVVIPSAPQAVAGSPGPTQAVISFSPPASNGGAAIDNYQVACGSSLVAGSVSPIAVNGLVSGTNYSCQVRAHNIAGWGTYSSIVYVTPY